MIAGSRPTPYTNVELELFARAGTLTMTDLFCGSGGLSEGFRQAGFQICTCSNHALAALATHAWNHRTAFHHLANLHETNFARIYRHTDVLGAGISCRGHSPAARRKLLTLEEELAMKDEITADRATAWAVIDAADINRYKVIVVENVRRFLRWAVFPAWHLALELVGYELRIYLLQAADIGPSPVPQIRERVIIIATRKDLDLDVDLTPPGGSIRAAGFVPKTRIPIFKVLPAPGLVRTPASTVLDMSVPFDRFVGPDSFVGPQLEQIELDNVPYLLTWRSNSKARRADMYPTYGVCASGNHLAVGVRDSDGRVHHRFLTNLELQGVQGFSPDYRHFGTQNEVRRQVGNAVPVSLSRAVAQQIRVALGAA
ncbi:DNA cytosine methyltransferase [Nocardia sp. NPDC055321]